MSRSPPMMAILRIPHADHAGIAFLQVFADLQTFRIGSGIGEMKVVWQRDAGLEGDGEGQGLIDLQLYAFAADVQTAGIRILVKAQLIRIEAEPALPRRSASVSSCFCLCLGGRSHHQ